jgi:hypothetical protein
MAWARVLRLADKEEDIRRIILLARLDFLSDFSSLVVPVEDEEPAVGGGERDLPWSRLEEVDTRLPMDNGRCLVGDVGIEDGREEDLTEGVETECSI